MMKSNPSVLVIGGINMDLVMKASRMPKIGESLLAQDFKMVPGGKASNYAVAVIKLGGKAKLIAKVGDDVFGQTLVDNLRKTGVEVNHIRKTSKKSTGVALVVVNKSGDNSILVVGGANFDWLVEEVDSIEDSFQEFGILLLSLEIPPEVVDRVLSVARRHNQIVILDPGPAQRCSESLLSKVNIVTPNETEAEALTGEKVCDLNSALRAATKMLKMGVETVIMKLGQKGAFLVDKKGEKHFPGIKVSVVDTTAAGDAFTGALAYCYAQGLPLGRAVQFANHVGALTVTRFGSQPSIPDKVEVKKFIDFCGKIC